MDRPLESTNGELSAVELTQALLAYFQQYPQAMDTLTGIAMWWMPTHGGRIDLRTMRTVLESLTEQRILDRVRLGDEVHYRLMRTESFQMH